MEKNEVGTPQGGVISPLLANIYLHEFDRFWTEQRTVDGKLIRYADDFVILFKTREDAELGLKLVMDKLTEMGLRLNTEKTRVVDMSDGEEGFDFLGFHHRRLHSWKYGKPYTLKWPRRNAVTKFKRNIREKLASREILLWPTEEVVKSVNPFIRGWMNYFRYGNSAQIFSTLDSYVHERLALWWSKKHQRKGRCWTTHYRWSEHKRTGIQVMGGNVVYWSTLRMRKKEGHLKAV
jgi:RNA-directed DNA polymerase